MRDFVDLTRRSSGPSLRTNLRRSPATSRCRLSSDSPVEQHRAHASAISRRHPSELCWNNGPRNGGGRREGRVPIAPMVRVQKNARGRTTGTSRTTGLPCAMALRLIRDLPRDRRSCPCVATTRKHVALASAPGGQDHTTSPCASGLFVGATNRAATQHAHRIPLPTSVTVAKRPSLRRRDVQISAPDLPDDTSRFFFSEGLDRFSQRVPVGQISHAS